MTVNTYTSCTGIQDIKQFNCCTKLMSMSHLH